MIKITLLLLFLIGDLTENLLKKIRVGGGGGGGGSGQNLNQANQFDYFFFLENFGNFQKSIPES